MTETMRGEVHQMIQESMRAAMQRASDEAMQSINQAVLTESEKLRLHGESISNEFRRQQEVISNAIMEQHRKMEEMVANLYQGIENTKSAYP